MSELDQALGRLRANPGVDQLVLLGRDGLVVQTVGGTGEEEPVAARVPAVALACEALGRAADAGDFATAVIEFSNRVGIITSISGELLLAVFLKPGIGFAPLLKELRLERARLVELL